MRPPLTVVLINNSGGGIFSFLPIANDMQEDIFTQLWSTPQNVDLAGVHTSLSQEACPALLHCVMTEEAIESPLPGRRLGTFLVSIVRELGSLGDLVVTLLQACAGHMASRIRE